MARSGTSWIGKIFDSHPITLYKHEPDRRMPGVPMAPRLDEMERFRDSINQFVTRLPSENRSHVAGSLPVFPKQYRSRLVQQLHTTSVLAGAAASSMGLRFPVWQCAEGER